MVNTDIKDGSSPKRDYKTLKRVAIAIAALLFVALVAPALLRAFAMGLKGEYDPQVNENKIDPRTCEFVLTRERDESFLKCPIPKDMRVPNWPDKPAPLNTSKDGK